MSQAGWDGPTAARARGWAPRNLGPPHRAALRRFGARRRGLGAVALVVATLLASACGADDFHLSDSDAAALTGGNPHRGRVLVRDYGCAACHTVPGVPGATRKAGPPLAGLAGRMYIAGVLSNSPANLIRWIEDPPSVDSLTAMPNVGVTPSDARDIAAYLYTLR